ncbi:(2Fe-2S)-binding protein [Roseovarius sp. Pro17]|uniref:(2Fe-2S)-binding protein n=1 Tax=Roseovarius sp. Pro17 TaxID=3108175 RepID=UPI002D776C6D|nr:(2Fe-2S)-binding protein [Roseovarius sp. Pro17]
MPVSFTLNDRQRSYSGDPRTSLLVALRDEFRLTGAKDVCGEGFCGACIVYVDGAPKVSCLQPVGALEGAEITTIEGIGSVETLNPVQQAFVDFDVVQCGMCFPGMVMTLTHFLRGNPHPSRDQVKSALVGNICRCTGYERIIDAVMSLHNSVEPLE